MVKKPSFFEKLFGGLKHEEKPDAARRSGERSRLSKPGSLTQKDRVVPRPESKLQGKQQATPARPEAKSQAQTPTPAQKPTQNKANGAGAPPQSKPKVQEPTPPRPEAKGPAKPAPATPQTKKPENMDLPPKMPAPEEVRPAQESSSGVLTRVLGGNKREEAAVALSDGFRDLSNLLQGIDRRMEEQGQRTGELSTQFEDLPAMARAQIDFMSKIATQMTEQKEQTGKLLTKLGGLPELLDGIHRAIESNAVAEQRTERTLDDFRDTMNRIHDSIGTLTTESQKAVRETAASFERSHARASETFQKTQSETHDSFRLTQEAHLRKLDQMMEANSKSTKAITTMLVVVATAVVVVLFAMLMGG